MTKIKCSIHCPHIFSNFSSNFLQMTKLNCFHHRSPVNKCLQEHCVSQSRFCFLLEWILAVAARLLRQLILHLLWQCPWNISYDISCVCVSVRMNFSAICRLAPCLWDKSRNSEMPLKTCAFKHGWDSETGLSSRAPPTPQTAPLKMETARSRKRREAKKWLYKIQPLRQKIAIA